MPRRSFPLSLLLSRVQVIIVTSTLFLLVSSVAEITAHAATKETKTELQISQASSEQGSPVTFSATVTALDGSSVNPGEVSFCDATAAKCIDAAILGRASLSKSGVATIKLKPSIGCHRIYALFHGSASYASSKSTAKDLNIEGLSATTMAVASSGGPDKFTVTATVVGQPRSRQKPYPTGSISFYDVKSSSLLGTAPLCCAKSGFQFATGNSTPLDFSLDHVVSGDFNNDGTPDLAAGDGWGVRVILGDPDHAGEFLQGVHYPTKDTSYNVRDITAADFNGDGVIDLAITDPYPSPGVGILPGDPAHPGQFQPEISFPATAADFLASVLWIASGDFNGDGLPDIAAVILRNDTQLVVVSVWLNDSSHPGQFLVPVDYPMEDVGNGFPQGFSVGDFNGDGVPDMGVFLGGSATLPQRIDVFLGDTAHPGQFLAVKEYTSGPIYDLLTSGAIERDFNLDGLLDRALLFGYPNSIGLFLGDPVHPGLFQPELIFPTTFYTSQPNILASEDFDGDGVPDLAAFQDAIQLWYGRNEEIVTATLDNVSVPDLKTDSVRAVYSGDDRYSGSQSEPIHLDTPIISGIRVANITDTSVTVEWSSNVVSYGIVNYGTTTSMGTVTPKSEPPSTAHSVVLSNLSPLTTYYFEVESIVFFKDGTQQSTTSSQSTFVTARFPSATSLTVSSPTANKGTPIILTSAVSGNGSSLTSGEVQFCSALPPCTNLSLLATAEISPQGTAVAKILPELGTTSVYAWFTGTATIAPSSSSPQSITIVGVGTSITTIEKSGSGGRYSLNARVIGQGSLPLTGTVTFLDAQHPATQLGEVPLGQSTAQFRLGQMRSYSTNGQVRSVAVADMNGDGVPDLVESGNGLSILLADPDHPGQFSPATNYSSGSHFSSLAVGDFNRDGLPDLALTDSVSGYVTVFLNNSAHPGVLLGPYVYQILFDSPNQSYSVTVEDFDQDGALDLVVAGIGSDDSKYPGFTFLCVVHGIPDQPGAFEDGGQDVYNADYPMVLATADLHHSGAKDLIIGEAGPYQATPGIKINRNGPFYSTNKTPTSLAVGDFNQDGALDIAYTDGKLRIMFGDPKNPTNFQSPVSYYTRGNASAVATGDLNGDGVADLVVSNSDNDNLRVFLGDGSNPGKFLSVRDYKVGEGNTATALAIADLNADGKQDLAMAVVEGENGKAVVMSAQSSVISFALLADITPGEDIQYVAARYSGDSNYHGSQSCAINLFSSGPTEPVISGMGVSSITLSTAQISWQSSFPTNGFVEYGTSAELGSRTPWDNALSKSHSTLLSHLTPGTTYFYRVNAYSYFDGCTPSITSSAIQTFKTSGIK